MRHILFPSWGRNIITVGKSKPEIWRFFCDHCAVFVPKVRHTTGPLISKINAVQITVLLSFHYRQERVALSEPADAQSIVRIYFPVSSQNKLQFSHWFFFNLPAMSYHAAIVFGVADQCQQAPRLPLRRPSSSHCLESSGNRKTKTSLYHPERWGRLCPSLSPFGFFSFQTRLKTQPSPVKIQICNSSLFRKGLILFLGKVGSGFWRSNHDHIFLFLTLSVKSDTDP